MSAVTVPAFAASSAGPGPDQLTVLISNRTTATTSDPKMITKMMRGARHMTGCLVLMNTNNGGMSYMIPSDKRYE